MIASLSSCVPCSGPFFCIGVRRHDFAPDSLEVYQIASSLHRREPLVQGEPLPLFPFFHPFQSPSFSPKVLVDACHRVKATVKRVRENDERTHTYGESHTNNMNSYRVRKVKEWKVFCRTYRDERIKRKKNGQICEVDASCPADVGQRISRETQEKQQAGRIYFSLSFQEWERPLCGC